MQRKLIIIVEIIPYLREDSQRVKREFLTELSPSPKTHLKLLDGPPREIRHTNQICNISKDQKTFDGLIEKECISYFPDENIITILFQDHTSYLALGKIKVSDVVSEYKKHKWEILP